MVLGSDLLDGRKKRPFADVNTHTSTSTSASKPGAVPFSAWHSSPLRPRRPGEIPAGTRAPPLPYAAAHEFIDQRTLDYAAEVVERMKARQANRALAAQYDEEILQERPRPKNRQRRKKRQRPEKRQRRKKSSQRLMLGEAATQEAPATQEELAASDAWAADFDGACVAWPIAFECACCGIALTLSLMHRRSAGSCGVHRCVQGPKPHDGAESLS
jgi:hypothetical protein